MSLCILFEGANQGNMVIELKKILSLGKIQSK